MRVAILITAHGDNAATEAAVTAARTTNVPHDIFVVECGTPQERVSPLATHWINPEQASSVVYCQLFGIKMAQLKGTYTHIWMTSAKQEFSSGGDVVERLVSTMTANPRMAILAPSDANGSYPGANPTDTTGWRAATTVAVEGMMMRAEVVDDIGYLNKFFEEPAGAIHELSYKIYSAGGFIAYTNDVVATRRDSESASRDNHEMRRFAFDYMLANYGWDWHERCFAATVSHSIAVDTFALHRKFWAREFTAEELEARRQNAIAEATSGLSAGTEATSEGAALVQAILRQETESSAITIPEVMEVDNSDEPWPLVSNAKTIAVAWPRYDSAADLEVLMAGYGRMFLDNPDTCLALRHDPAHDLPIESAMAAVTWMFNKVLGEDANLEVLVIDDAMNPSQWHRLGRSVTSSLVLPSSHACDTRAEFISTMGAEIWDGPAAVRKGIATPSVEEREVVKEQRQAAV